MHESDWLRHLLPLPQEISILSSIDCPPAGLGVVVVGESDATLAAAAAVLERAGAIPDLHAPAMMIRLGRLDDLPEVDGDRLRGLPHADQAYRVTCPSRAEILVAGVTSVGAYYGALTLAQLLGAARGGDTITVPLPEIVDWPAFDERGLWNFPDAGEWIDWLAGWKLNYGKMADTRLATVERGVPGSATIDAELMRHAGTLGFRYVPYILHLNFLGGSGLFGAYPELAGRGDAALAGRYHAHKTGDPHRAPCASQPVLVDLLADWMASIAAQGATEISGWLSERPCQCECARCAPVGQFVLETRAFLAAWERVRADVPGLRLRIFSSTTTPQQDDLVLDMLPAEVKFERACATGMERVRQQPRDRFANGLLDAAAASGRWIASYDVPIGAFGNVDTPEFKVPQFGAQRIRDFVTQLAERGYEGAYGMLAWATMAREICGFSIAALAEYAWNPTGRGIGDLAAAWATAEGLEDPPAVAAWAERLGEVEFDVYDADFPMGYSWGRTADMVEHRQAPRFGDGLFRRVRDEADFERQATACREAAACVASLARRDLCLAAAVVGSYVGLTGAVWRVAHRYAHADLAELDEQTRLEADLIELESAGAANVSAIRAWRTELGPEPWHHRVYDAIAATEATVERICSHIRNRELY